MQSLITNIATFETSRIVASIGTTLDRVSKNNEDQFAYVNGEVSKLLQKLPLHQSGKS